MIKDYVKKIKEGFSFALGIFLFFAILFSVYAFVEPSSGPASNYVIDWLSPLNIMHNDTNQRVEAISGMTANSGMYDNRISEGSFPAAYTEVCFNGGSTFKDQHTAGESTAGENCSVGDVGFIIEVNERTTQHWEDAKITCTQLGMRLPEPLEFKYSCQNATTFGLNSMTGNWEWSSNLVIPIVTPSPYYGGAVINLGLTCDSMNWDWVARNTAGSEGLHPYRCVK